MEQKIRAILGQHIYGADDDTPQSVVLELLGRAGLTVSTFEYATGGALAALLAEPPGHGQHYHGGFLAFSHHGLSALGVEDAVLARDGVVTPEGVAALARLARQRLGTDLGLALAGVLEPGAIDPQPVGSLLVALDDGRIAPRTAAISYATAPSEMRRLGALAALNLLRLSLLGS
jgi:nicotinamide-nucleotide amidase